jgi:hypothetical protein
MRLRRKSLAVEWMGIALAILAIGGLDRAQSESRVPPPGPRPVAQRIGPGSEAYQEPFGPLSPDDALGFVGVEAGLGGKTIAGAPFTATLSTRATQVLADGNRINRVTSGVIARDSRGRTRREMTLPAIGPWATSGMTAPHVILINDAAAGVHYILEPDLKIARKLPSFPKLKNKPDRIPPPPSAEQTQNGVTVLSLGTQSQDGLTLEGTRTTRTIPAGAIGNDKPIQISVERWYSRDLQMNVRIDRNDPRTGETFFQLTNIERQEPDAALFEVPVDYTVKEARRMDFVGKWHKRQPPSPGDGSPEPQPPPN